MREGRTLTRPMSIETRQHDLFNIDFGEGAPRKALVAGLILTTLWFVVMWALLGPPTSNTGTLYILPPALLTVYGWQESESNPRRRKITQWVLAARYVVAGHRPVIGLGRKDGPAYERSLLRRVADRFGSGDAKALVMPWRAEEARMQASTTARQAPTGRPVWFGGRVHLVGTDAAAALMHRREATPKSTRKTKRKGQD